MKAPLSLAACIALTCYAAVAADEPTAEVKWLQDANGCKFLNPWPSEPPSKITWTGQCADGFVSGPGNVRVGRSPTFRGEFLQGRIVKGTIEYGNGESYEGDAFLDNQLHGDVIGRMPERTIMKLRFDHGKAQGEHAEITWPDGNRYSGEIEPRSMFPEGKGLLEYATGTIYEGEFKQGRATGVGVMKFRDGEVHTGTFVDAKLDGHGSIFYADQSRYEGDMRMGKESGIGKLEFADGAVYEGAFVASYFQGKGKIKYADGGTYEGDFLAGHAHGTGTMVYSNGNQYVGQFISGKRHGTGRLTQSTGETAEGEWKADQLSGKCRKVNRDSVYDGQCLDNLASGQGRFEYKARDMVYEGQFLEDQYDGKGSLRIGKLAYEGMFKGGAMEGPGTLSVGKLTMHGEFKSGALAHGTITGADGRTFEVDLEKSEILEVMKDGSKHPIDELPADITI